MKLMPSFSAVGLCSQMKNLKKGLEKIPAPHGTVESLWWLWNLVKWQADDTTTDLNEIVLNHLITAREMEMTIVVESLVCFKT